MIQTMILRELSGGFLGIIPERKIRMQSKDGYDKGSHYMIADPGGELDQMTKYYLRQAGFDVQIAEPDFREDLKNMDEDNDREALAG